MMTPGGSPPGAPTSNAIRPSVKQRLALLIPEEHGSWGMLITVLLIPHLVFQLSTPSFTLALAAVILFFVRRPVEILLHPKPKAWERSVALHWAATLLPIGTITAALALFRSSHSSFIVLMVAVAAGGLVCVGTVIDRPGRMRGSFLARLLSMVGVALFIPLQAMVSGARAGVSFALGLLVICFFVNVAIRVRSCIRGRKLTWMRPFGLAASALFFVTLAWMSVGTHLLLTYAFVALIPTTLQTWYTLLLPPSKIDVRRLGIGEILHTAVFILVTAVVHKA